MPGNDAAVGHGPPDPVKQRNRAEQAEIVKDEMYRLATEASHDMTRVAAGRAFLDRIEGTPVQRTITIETDDISDLDDAALARRQSELEAALCADAGGDVSPEVPS